MRFENYAGDYQLKIQSPEDLQEVLELDEAHWVATSAPIEDLASSTVFLDCVDTDDNGRIRTDEVKEAVCWLSRHLENLDQISDADNHLQLEDIDTSHPDGTRLYQAAKHILSNLQRSDQNHISLSEVRDIKQIMANGAANGDGVIPPSVLDDPDLQTFCNDLIETMGGVEDASGEPGITENHLTRFERESEAYLDWKRRVDTEPEIMVFDEETEPAYQLIQRLAPKIESFFSLCDLYSFDREYYEMMSDERDWPEDTDQQDEASISDRLKQSPLNRPNHESRLDLIEGANPYYREDLDRFRRLVLAKLDVVENDESLTPDTWNRIQDEFRPYQEWKQSGIDTPLSTLDDHVLIRYREGDYLEQLYELIEEDKAVANELNEIRNVEQLILYQKWLMELVNNFVSVPYLYNPERRSLFEMGTLVMDGRRFELNVLVRDREQHKKMSENSGIFLLYVEVNRKGEEPFEVATAVTAGVKGGLCPGKRGVFFTVDGKIWDARVVEIIENPISLWEAIKSPFRRLKQFVARKVEEFKEDQYKDLEQTVDKKIKGEAINQGTSKTAMFRDVLTGGGIAAAAMGSSFAYMLSKLQEINPLHVLVVIGVIGLAFLIPLVIIAYLKLKQRDVSHILEASDWAINTRMRLTGSLCRLFTRRPDFPENAQLEHRDLAKLLSRSTKSVANRRWKRGLLVLEISALILLVLWMVGA